MSLPEFLKSHLSKETGYFAAGPFVLESGRRLDEVNVAYRTWGNPANAAHRAVLICHALTGSADVESWWPGLIGKGSAFDPETDYIVCSNILGGCYGTTGPVSRVPGSPNRYRADFPRITVRDMVRLQRRLLDYLGVQQLELVTGPSLGGMQALEWAALYPDRVRSIVPIGVGGKHSAWCIGMSEAQRAAIYADADWNGGYYSDERPPRKGLAAARMMAVCSYRSWSGFQRRFGREECADGDFQVQSYLRHQGAKINDRFDANSYVRLTQAMNDFDLARGRGNYIDVLESIRQRALIVSVSSDILYPAHEQALLARHLPNARYEILESDYGHDGFLVQTAELSRLISEFRLSDGAGFQAREAAA
ncbi:MAG TPA: homoserine O-acetyltransferase [Woeseiaceae bacterium]|nr:homoserine O-acetyltransferase [Woeseiaceae bacterium]